MIRNYIPFLIVILITLSLSNLNAQLPALAEDKDILSPLKTPRSSHLQVFNPARNNTVVLFEDFEDVVSPQLPNGWDPGDLVEQQNNNGIGLGTFVSAWRTGNAAAANNGGYMPVPDIPGNHFAFSNDDGPPCNCNMEEVGLTTPQLDFTGLDNMIVTFDVYSQAVFGGENLYLEISTDGENFDSIYEVSDSPEWQTAVVNLSAFDNAPEVWLRFSWSDNGNWAAGVAFDNLLVAENYDFNVGILRAHTAQFDAAWNDLDVISGEYSQTPLSQASAMSLGARIINKGAQPMENVVLSVSIYQGASLLGSYNSQVIPILYPLQQQNVFVNTGFLPTEAANYTIEYELLAAGDEDLLDNVAVREKSYSDDVFAMDDGVADSFRDNISQSYTIGNLFEIPNEGAVCHSIGVGIGSPTTPLTQIQVRIYNSNFVFVAGSPNYQIQAEDIIGLGEDHIVNIPLSSPVELEAGQDYIAAVSYFHNPVWQFAIANSGSTQEQFSVFQDELGDWFYVTTTPMVRMNLSPTVSIQEFTNVETLRIFPNPMSENYTVDLGEMETGNARFSISNIHGQILTERALNIGSSKAIQNPVALNELKAGLYFLTVSSNHSSRTVRFIKSK